MRKISYSLFPLAFRLFGFLLIVLSLYSWYSTFSVHVYQKDLAKAVISPIGFLLIGLIISSARSSMTFDKINLLIRKRMHILGIQMSDEIVKIPKECEGLIIKQKNKTGTGHIDLVIPVSYNLKSGDMYFLTNRSVVRLINTDTNQAIKIAGIIKEEFDIDYKLL